MAIQPIKLNYQKCPSIALLGHHKLPNNIQWIQFSCFKLANCFILQICHQVCIFIKKKLINELKKKEKKFWSQHCGLYQFYKNPPRMSLNVPAARKGEKEQNVGQRRGKASKLTIEQNNVHLSTLFV